MARQSIDYDGNPCEPDRDGMELPEPEICGTCAHLKRCLTFGYTRSAARTSCDFHPVRFAKAEGR